MTRQENIKAQIKRASEILPKIEELYNKSLNEKSISSDLKLDVQTFFGHLRSSLDYLAKDIAEKYCPQAKTGHLYFPIRNSQADYLNYMKESYPGLAVESPDLYNYLESKQTYKEASNNWLGLFNKVNNDNKHNDLVEQERIETKRVNVVSPGGGSVSWGPGVTFGSGVSIMGVPIDPRTQLPVQNNIVTTEIVTWVDFKFQNVDASAIWLMRESLKQIEIVNTEISKYL